MRKRRRLSWWTVFASVHMSFTVLRIRRSVFRASPFLSISSSASSWLCIYLSSHSHLVHIPPNYTKTCYSLYIITKSTLKILQLIRKNRGQSEKEKVCLQCGEKKLVDEEDEEEEEEEKIKGLLMRKRRWGGTGTFAAKYLKTRAWFSSSSHCDSVKGILVAIEK